MKITLDLLITELELVLLPKDNMLFGISAGRAASISDEGEVEFESFVAIGIGIIDLTFYF